MRDGGERKEEMEANDPNMKHFEMLCSKLDRQVIRKSKKLLIKKKTKQKDRKRSLPRNYS